MTVAEVWNLYAAAKGARKSFYVTANRMKPVLVHFGATPVMELTARRWYAYRELRNSGTYSKKKAPKPITVNFELDWFRGVLAWAVCQEYIDRNPLAIVRRERVDATRDTTVSDADIAKVLAVSPPVLRAFIVAAVDTGMRCMELLTLRWQQIDPQGYVSLPKASTKTGRRRMVKLSTRALAALAELPQDDEHEFIFRATRRNSPAGHYGARHMGKMWREAATLAGLQAAPGDGQVRIHDLRHSFATNAIRAGVPLPIVQRMTGHSNLAMLGRYVHANHSDIDAAVARMTAARQAPQPAEVV